MVGGYIYPFKDLKLGTNDLVKMFGSVAAVKERIDTVFKCGKPAIAIIVGGDGQKGAMPFTVAEPIDTGYIMKAGMFVITVTIDESTAVAQIGINYN